MKLAANFRYIAREALKGKWGIVVIAGLIASLLGALGSDGPEVFPVILPASQFYWMGNPLCIYFWYR